VLHRGASDDQQRRIDHQAQVRGGDPYQPRRIFDQLSRTLLALVGGGEEVLDSLLAMRVAGVVAARPLRAQGLHARQRLQAAGGAEILVDVLRPHAHEGDLAGQMMMAAVQLAVDHDAGADAAADVEKRAGVVAAGRALPALAEDGEVHVVLDEDGHTPQRLLQDLAHRHLLPALEVGGQRDDGALGVIDGARRRRRHRQQLVGRDAGLAHEAAHVAGDLLQQRLGSESGGSRPGAGRQPCPAEIGEGGAGLRGAERDPGDEAVARVELHERGAAAAARRPGAEMPDEAVPDELDGEGPDGRGRQRRRFRELRPGERLRPVHGRRQQALEVEMPQVAGVSRLSITLARESCNHLVLSYRIARSLYRSRLGMTTAGRPAGDL
jgi:hypothetical protein